MELLTEMLGGESPFGKIIEKDQENHYYNSFGLHLLKEFQNKEQYYHFILTVLKDFKSLDKEKKENLMNIMKISNEPIIQEKIVYREPKKQKKKKPQIIMNDDY